MRHLGSLGCTLLVITRLAFAQSPSPSSPLQRGLVFAQQQRFDLAEQAFQEALREPRTRVDAQYALARLYSETANWDKALDALRPFLEARPQSHEGFYLAGYVLYRRGQFQASVLSLNESVRLKSDNPAAHKMLGLNYYQLNRLEQAESEWRTAVQQAPKMAEAHYYLGRFYYTLNRVGEARSSFEAAIEADPQHMRAYDNLGLTLEALGETQQARQAYQRALQLNGQLALPSRWPCLNYGELLLKSGEVEVSIQYFRKALAVDPNWGRAHTNLGKALLKKGNPAEARRCFEAAVTLDPEYPAGHYQLGLLLRGEGKLAEAQKEMQLFETYRNKGEKPLKVTD